MDGSQLLNSVTNFLTHLPASYYRWGVVLVLILIVIWIIRRLWPDKAVVLFIWRNIRVTPQKLAEVRELLAGTVGTEINESQKAIANQQLRIQALQLEVERVQQTVNVKSVSRLVGKKLQAIEKDHLLRLQILQSEQAREALRRVTEKEINDLLKSINVDSSGIPEFHFTETDANSKHQKVA